MKTRRTRAAPVTRPFPLITLSVRSLLCLLLAVDFAFILTNVLAALAQNAHLIERVPRWMKITEDLEPPEDFNYLKWLVIVLALSWMALRERWLAPMLWAVVFTMILADDSFQLHERLGDLATTWLRIPDNALLYGRDLGELLVFGTMGVVALTIFAFLFTRRDAPTRQMNWRYLLIVIGIGFFGVVIDGLHSVLAHLSGADLFGTMTRQALGMIEDGGEMVVGSLAVALTLGKGVPAGSDDTRTSAPDNGPGQPAH